MSNTGNGPNGSLPVGLMFRVVQEGDAFRFRSPDGAPFEPLPGERKIRLTGIPPQVQERYKVAGTADVIWVHRRRRNEHPFFEFRRGCQIPARLFVSEETMFQYVTA